MSKINKKPPPKLGLNNYLKKLDKQIKKHEKTFGLEPKNNGPDSNYKVKDFNLFLDNLEEDITKLEDSFANKDTELPLKNKPKYSVTYSNGNIKNIQFNKKLISDFSLGVGAEKRVFKLSDDFKIPFVKEDLSKSEFFLGIEAGFRNINSSSCKINGYALITAHLNAGDIGHLYAGAGANTMGEFMYRAGLSLEKNGMIIGSQVESVNGGKPKPVLVVKKYIK